MKEVFVMSTYLSRIFHATEAFLARLGEGHGVSLVGNPPPSDQNPSGVDEVRIVFRGEVVARLLVHGPHLGPAIATPYTVPDGYSFVNHTHELLKALPPS